MNTRDSALKRFLLSALIGIGGGCAAATASSATLSVDAANQTGIEEGTDVRPFSTIQAALKAAGPGDAIQVAAGTYNGPILMADKPVQLLGGYPGGTSSGYGQGLAGDFNSRAPTLHVSIIQGAAESAVVRLQHGQVGLQGTIIDGLTIRGGNRGILMEDNTSPPSLAQITLSNNRIENNGVSGDPGHRGGGILVVGRDITIRHNIIRDNRSGRGAGIATEGEDIRNLLVEANLVENNIGEDDHGGGLWLAGTMTVRGNLIQGNSTGEGVGYGWGGGITVFNPGTVAVLSSNIIRYNHAPTAGGGVFIDDGAECTLLNELVYRNSAGENGGGVYVDGAEWMTPPSTSLAHLRNCTIADNDGPNPAGGNGLYATFASVDVVNSIFWGNAGAQDIFIPSPNDTSLTVGYSLSRPGLPGSGNLQADPLFADQSGGDYHLRSVDGRWNPNAEDGAGAWILDATSSPALDAGDPASPFDLEPLPNGFQINLGAYGNTTEASKSAAELNQPPTDISLSNRRITENMPPLTNIGSFTAIDANRTDRHSFSLISGTGGEDNAAFTIQDGVLLARSTFDYEATNRFSIRVRAEDRKAAAIEKSFTIEVVDANDPPSVILAEPAQGARVTSSAVVPLLATASDQDGTVVSVEFLVNGQGIGAAEKDAGSWSKSWTASVEGRFLVAARAVDTAGNAAFSEPMVLTVTAPLPALPSGVPFAWESRGVGGGGALFSPSISPHNSNEIYLNCDMSELFRSTDFGASWETIDFREIQGGNRLSQVQFTSEPSVLYALDYSLDTGQGGDPVKSVDGGLTWSPLPSNPTEGEIYSVWADWQRTDRILFSTYDTLFQSGDGGLSAEPVFTAADLLVGGAFFDGDTVFVGTRAGLLISTNGGRRFALSEIGGIPGNEEIVSFAGARQDGRTRFFCITYDAGSSYPTLLDDFGFHWGYANVYTLDYGTDAQWTPSDTGLAGDHLFIVSTSRDNIETAYAAGAGIEPIGPVVYRTVNGGESWEKVFRFEGNQNVVTGWQGEGGDRHWTYGEFALGFAVAPGNPDRAVITDLGYPHVTKNGGKTWQAAYVNVEDTNPAGQKTPTGKSYRGIGLENTSCWWLTWLDSARLFACFTDIGGLRSADAGQSWAFNVPELPLDNSYYCVKHPENGALFLAVSSVHDLYQSRYLEDEAIDGGNGALLYSKDGGANWSMLHDFGHPVIWLALDPTQPNRLYASVVHSGEGGIYVTSNLQDGSAATWRRLAEPPRTSGHPFNVHVLSDGSLIATYSGHRSPDGAFLPRSGVFITHDGGASWTDRSDPGMHYWTKDLIVDPHDAEQQTWYASVFSGWGGAPNDLGGVYRTVDRGQSWTRISRDALDRVESCAVSPVDPNLMFVATATQGLWFSPNINSPSPDFLQLANYPFRNPTRVFYNPYDMDEIWVTSFGNGLRVGRIPEAVLRFQNARMTDGIFRAELALETGRSATISASYNLQSWTDLSTLSAPNGVISFEDRAEIGAHRFYRARAIEGDPAREQKPLAHD